MRTNQPNRQPASRHAAFTLIELLVVISIIAVLVGLIFPSFGTVKEQGMIATCTNHMQQIYRAMVAYTQDNNGRFPNNEGGPSALPLSWVCTYSLTGSNGVLSITQGLLWPYINDVRVYRCPAYPDKDYVRSYSMADYLSAQKPARTGPSLTKFGETKPRAERFNQVEYPSQTLMLIEENPTGYPPRDGRVYINDGFFVYPGDRPATYHRYDPSNAYKGKANVVFVDGHMQLCSATESGHAYEMYFHFIEAERKTP